MALGRFVHAFAQLESTAFLLLREKAELTPDIAGALLSGVKADGALSLMRRLCETKGWEIPKHAERALSQFGLINAARNQIVHFAPDLENGEYVVSDRRKNIPTRVRTNEFFPETLDQLRADTETIHASLYVWLIGDHSESWDRHGNQWAQLALAPWQYKDTRQNSLQGKNQKRNHKRKDPPRSSRA